MGSPLRNITRLISPAKFPSPRSPKFLNVPKIDQKNVVLEHQRRITRSPKFEPTKFLQNHSPIRVQITDFESERRKDLTTDILLNTPIKQSLLKHGLGENRFVKILGKGSFGTVFRATYKGKTVAAKLLDVNNVLREKNILNLNHENIVRIIDVIENSKEYFSIIIMEYVPDSRDLQSILDDPQINTDNKIVRYVNDICKGLKYCHDNGILHLDLKPKNVLVCNDSFCKICDFGNSAKISDVGETFKHKGTAIYTPPEILLGQPPSTKSDVYSLGIIMWQLQHRKNPYNHLDNSETIIYKVVKCQLRPKCETTGNEFSKVYMKCWASDPNERPEVNDVLMELKFML